MTVSEAPFSNLLVASKDEIASGIFQFELRHPLGRPLAPFGAGAHLTVQTPSRMRRNYSLCNNPSETLRYVLAVKRDPHGRGGSLEMADQVSVGSLLPASAPRNNFGLTPGAQEVLLIAGGIGITPILSMARHLKSDPQARFKLVYCTRDATSTAFLQEISTEFGGFATIHHDGGKTENAIDLWPEFETPRNAHVYCCGPKALMESVADMSGHWPSGHIHFESFGVAASDMPANAAFSVRLLRSQKTIPVSATQSLLQALRAGGCTVASSCESGTCGSCRTGLLAGQAEHRDMVLMDDERAHSIMPCVSRALPRASMGADSPELVLDL